MKLLSIFTRKQRTKRQLKADNIKEVTITSEMFGSKWPFKFSSAILQLRRKYFVTLQYAGRTYALNGLAIDFYKLPSVFEKGLVLPDAKHGQKKMYKSIGPVIEYALEHLK